MRDVLIDVTGLVPSTSYLKITTAVMDRFGVAVVEQYGRDEVKSLSQKPCGTGFQAGRSISKPVIGIGSKFIVAAPQRYQGTTFAIEPDASNATYFLTAPAIAGGRVTVERLGTDSIQGDARFVDVLERMGCTVKRGPTRLTVIGPGEGKRLRGIDMDLNDMPDTAQTLAVAALFADGPTTIRNVANLRVKETDRLSALPRELAKLGATVYEWPDGLRIEPPERILPAVVDTYNDHRMAMSFTLAGLKCDGLTIKDAQCCGKTFPDFFERFERMTAATT
jgi:3-phosphoshikimate 1-carboxyvinyltransferase